MTNITTFSSSEANPLRVVAINGEPWFVAADVCAAVGISDTSMAVRRLDDDERGTSSVGTLGGTQEMLVVNESGLNAIILRCRDAMTPGTPAHKYRKWVTSEVLPSIRKTGGYTVTGGAPAPSAITPAKEFEALFGVARLIGLDNNAAALSANQAVTRLTGTNVLQLLGATHLQAEQQILFFTPTELGERIGVSGRKVNMLLAESGLQAKESDAWKPLPAADGLFRLFDTGKRHGSGVMVQQLKWAERVLNLIGHDA